MPGLCDRLRENADKSARTQHKAGNATPVGNCRGGGFRGLASSVFVTATIVGTPLFRPRLVYRLLKISLLGTSFTTPLST